MEARPDGAQHPQPGQPASRPHYRLRATSTPWAATTGRGARPATAPGGVAAGGTTTTPAHPAESSAPRSTLRRVGAAVWFGVILLALAIIPSIYSGLLTGSVKDPTGHLDRVPAAVVNLDRPADADGETIRLGQDLTEELVHPDEDADSLDWQPMGAAEARSALESGDVLAVLTVPASFSAHAAGLSTGEADDARQSTLRVETNDGANIIMGNIARTIGETAAATVAEGIGEEYVQNVLLGLTEVHDGMQEATDGAGQVTDGAREAGTGAQDLVVGIDQLADGSVALGEGAGQLAEGADAASAGASAAD